MKRSVRISLPPPIGTVHLRHILSIVNTSYRFSSRSKTMPGRLTGKVALVTGAGRGQGRSHAVHLAREGADVVLVDLCADITTNRYPLATVEDLDQTARQVEKLERRAVVVRGDVRDRLAMERAAGLAVSEL